MNYAKVNKRKIIAISRIELMQINITIPFAWISITCPKLQHLQPKENAQYTLFMKFDDIDTITFPSAGFITKQLFIPEDANTIVDFVKSLSDDIPIIVNCVGGISRSTAIAASITCYLGGDDSIFWEKTCPNQRVFQYMCEAFGIETPERKWKFIPGDEPWF